MVHQPTKHPNPDFVAILLIKSIQQSANADYLCQKHR